MRILFSFLFVFLLANIEQAHSCDIPARYQNLCQSLSDGLRQKAADTLGLRGQVFSIKQNPSLLKLIKNHPQPLQFLLREAWAGNTDAMSMLALHIKDEEWQDYWIDKATEKGNVFAFKIRNKRERDKLKAQGKLTENKRRALQKAQRARRFSLAISNSRAGRLSKYGHEIVLCELANHLYDSNGNHNQHYQKLESHDREWVDDNLLPMQALMRNGVDCAIRRLLRLPPDELTLADFGAYSDRHPIRIARMHCLADTGKYSSTFCGKVRKSTKKAIRLLDQILGSSADRTSDENVADRGNNIAIYLVHTALLNGKYDSALDFALSVGRLIDRDLVLTLAALVDPVTGMHHRSNIVEFMNVIKLLSSSSTRFSLLETIDHYTVKRYRVTTKSRDWLPHELKRTQCYETLAPGNCFIKFDNEFLQTYRSETTTGRALNSLKSLMPQLEEALRDEGFCFRTRVDDAPVIGHFFECRGQDEDLAKLLGNVKGIFASLDKRSFENFKKAYSVPSHSSDRTFERALLIALRDTRQQNRSICLSKHQLRGNTLGTLSLSDGCSIFSKLGNTVDIEKYLVDAYESGSIYAALALGILETNWKKLDKAGLGAIPVYDVEVLLKLPEQSDFGDRYDYLAYMLKHYGL